MGLAIPSAGVFDADDIQLQALAKKLPEMSIWRSWRYFDARQLDTFFNSVALGLVSTAGTGSYTFDADRDQIILGTGATAGSYCDAIATLPIEAHPSTIGFNNSYPWGAPGTAVFAPKFYMYSAGGGSGSNRPYQNIFIEKTPVVAAKNMSNEGFGFQFNAEFGISTEAQMHNGTTLTTVNSNLAVGNRVIDLVMRHTATGTERQMEMWLSEANDGDGRVPVVDPAQIDKHYLNLSDAAMLHLTVHNNSKAFDQRMFIQGMWVSVTHF